MQHRDRHGGRVFEEGTQKARRRELQRIAQAAAVAPLGGDPVSIVIVKMEVPSEFVGRQCLRVAAVALLLCGGQEADMNCHSASAQKAAGVTMRVRPMLPRCKSPAR